MKKLNVIYAGWGERFTLGVLADNGRDIVFEYTGESLKRGLQLSPYKLPLSEQSFGSHPEHQLRLPGLVSDSLPDGWGMLVMDKLFRKQGINPTKVSPLDRLGYLGDRAMGALAYEPAEPNAMELHDLKLIELAKEVQLVFEDDETETLLRKLVLLGGAPHGARPKVLVNYDKKKNVISTAESGRGTPILVKFPAHHEHKESNAIEALYCRLAQIAGIRVPEHYYFDLGNNLSAFGIERFDRDGDIRIPMHSAAAAAHVDFRYPQLDYVSLLRLTKLMTKDLREVLHAFDRCVFNVVFNNRDDHSKNFSYIMNKHGDWKFSPAFDLTYNSGPNGEHQMDICGEAREPRHEHLMKLAAKTGIKESVAAESIERIVGVSKKFREHANMFPIRKKTMEQIEKSIEGNRDRLAQ